MRAAVWHKGTALSLILGLLLATAGAIFTRGGAPISCAIGIHTCPCAPDPHGASDCCCAHPDPASDAAMKCRLTCDAAAAGVWLLPSSLPLAIVRPRVEMRPPAPASRRLRAIVLSVRSRPLPTLEQPPRPGA